MTLLRLATMADKYNISNYVRDCPAPLIKHGSLDVQFAWSELTPVIGREYHNADLNEILASNELLRDLAITGIYHSLFPYLFKLSVVADHWHTQFLNEALSSSKPSHCLLSPRKNSPKGWEN